jgi:hypothetical protein
MPVDLIGRGGVQGALAAHMMRQGRLDPNKMRPFIGKDGRSYITVFKGGDVKKSENYAIVPAMNVNATLRRDEWKQLDDAVMGVAEQRIGAVDALIARGLVFNLGNALGTTVLEYHDVTSELTASLTMDGITRAQNNRPDYSFNYLPIPIVHVDYEINLRELETSRNMSNPIDTTMAERAARTVKEKIEEMLFTDTSYSYGEKDGRGLNTIWSFLNHPDRNQVKLTTAWDDSSKTGKDIVDEVIAWKQVMINDRHYGPYGIYIPTAYETKLDEDYVGSTPDTNATITVRQRLMQIERLEFIEVNDKLPADNIVMVQLTSDVVRIVNGMGLQNIEWDQEGRFITKHKVMAIQVPQIRSDANGRSGLIHVA